MGSLRLYLIQFKIRPPPTQKTSNHYILLKSTFFWRHLDDQQKFLFEVVSQIDDCICDAEFDLGTDAVLYQKLKDLLEFVENYQENL